MSKEQKSEVAPVKVAGCPEFILRPRHATTAKIYPIKIFSNRHWIYYDVPLNKPCKLDGLTEAEQAVVFTHLKSVSTQRYESEWTGEVETLPNGRTKPIMRYKKGVGVDEHGRPFEKILERNKPGYKLERYIPVEQSESFDFEV